MLIMAEISPQSQVVISLSTFCNSFKSILEKGKAPLGCLCGPTSSFWHWPHVNAWPLLDGRRKINKPISFPTELQLFFFLTQPILSPFLSNPSSLVLFLSQFYFYFIFLALPLRRAGEQHLASHFMDLRSAFFPGWMWVDMCRSPLGGIAKRVETQWQRSKSVISAPLCVSLPATTTAAVVRGAENVLPDAGECRPKFWYYRQCHLFLNVESSHGLCHQPIKARRWSIYKEVYNLLNGTVKY